MIFAGSNSFERGVYINLKGHFLPLHANDTL